MDSQKTWALVDLDRDLPITTADSAALWSARELPALSTQTYLQWLTELSEDLLAPSPLHSPFDEPFEL
jgi:hypothetical protein